DLLRFGRETVAKLQQRPAEASIRLEARPDEPPHSQPALELLGHESLAARKHECRRSCVAGDLQLATQLEAAPRVGAIRQFGDRSRADLLGARAIRQQRLAEPRLPGEQGLALEQPAELAQAVAFRLTGKRCREPLP